MNKWQHAAAERNKSPGHERLKFSIVGHCCVERVARLEREAQTLKRIGDDMFRLTERLDAEKNVRDAEMAQIRSEVHEALGKP
jgi:SF-assemblin/beta giardin